MPLVMSRYLSGLQVNIFDTIINALALTLASRANIRKSELRLPTQGNSREHPEVANVFDIQ
jgi:hypothetical protein